MNKVTAESIIPFFPDDNRFVHFVARKHGLFFTSEDDVETARFIALKNVMLMVDKEYEYETTAHLNSLMETNVKHAIWGVGTHNNAKKRSLEIRTESEMNREEDMGSFFEVYDAEDYESEKRMLINDMMEVIRKNEEPKSLRIFEMHMEGYKDREISEEVGISTQAIQQRRKNTIKRLKNYYETDTWTDRANGKKVRTRVRSRPATKYKAERSDYTKALSYLGLA